MGVLSKALPKPAWTLQNKTLLQWGFDLLDRQGCRFRAANTHFKSDLLTALHPESELIHETTLLGSAGWFASVAPRVQEALMVWNADAIAPGGSFLGTSKMVHWWSNLATSSLGVLLP